jgi:hypothetical protein
VAIKHLIGRYQHVLIQGDTVTVQIAEESFIFILTWASINAQARGRLQPRHYFNLMRIIH